jgi:hypothetical protein
MQELRGLMKGAQNALGCLFSVLAVPLFIMAILIGYIKASDILFPEDPNVRVRQCNSEKLRYQRSMLCEAVYDIGEDFLKDPTYTYYCSNSEFSQRIKFLSSIYNFRLSKCTKEDADSFSQGTYEYLLSRGASVSECGKGADGQILVPQVQKQYDAFLACRSYRDTRD